MSKIVLISSIAIITILALILLIFALNWYLNKNVSYTNNLSDKKILIAYYSYSNHTEEIANMINQYLNCDIVEIKSEEYENKNIIELNKLVNQQIKNETLPKINKIDISNYDLIFVGSPVWKDDVALPVKSFLINNDFNGKIIIPFYTFGGFVDKLRLDNQIKEYSHNDSVLPSFLTVYFKFAFIEYRLTKWLNGINL